MWIKVKGEDDDWYVVNTDHICWLYEEDKTICFEKFSMCLSDESFNKLERLIKYV